MFRFDWTARIASCRRFAVAITGFLLLTSFALALDFYAPNEVYVTIAPYQYNTLTQRADASISYPTGNAGLDAIMAEFGVKALKPLYVHNNFCMSDPVFLQMGLHREYLFRFNDQKKWLWDFESLSRLSSRLKSIPGIANSDPVPGCTIDYSPSDWNLSGRTMWGLDTMHCRQAWDSQRGRSSVLVSSIDTGTDYTHADLQGNILVNTAEDIAHTGLPDSANTNGRDEDNNGYNDDVVGYNFVSHNYTEIPGASAAVGEQYSTRNNKPKDVMGHGTHTCGSLVAVTDNAVGVPSASFNVKAVAIRALFGIIYGGNITGTGFNDDFIAALQYAVVRGVRVVSMSFGGNNSDAQFQAAVLYAWQRNVALFGAAGNTPGTTMHYPAAYPHVMSVGATTTGNQRASFSTYGTWVKCAAPGTNIWSTMVVNTYNPSPYVAQDGTSMSCPSAAAVAALVLSRNIGLTNDRLDTILAQTATRLPGLQLGSGLINAQAAIAATSASVLSLLAPTGGEQWWMNRTTTIRWLAPDTVQNIRIEINRNYPTGTWDTLFASTPNDSAQNWVISGDTTSRARIRITDVSRPTVSDTCRSNIRIFYPWISVTRPNMADTLQEGMPVAINWNSGGVDSVDIYFSRYYPTTPWEVISSRVLNTGSAGWTVIGPASTTARFRVTKAGDTTISSMTSPLRLQTTGLIVTAPGNGDTTHIGMEMRINYVGPGTRYVNIQINRNYPTGNWEIIDTMRTANGSYAWTVTGPTSNNCRIRVFNSQNPLTGDTTHGSFVILPSAIALTAPQGGEVWTENLSYNITWVHQGFDGVNIQLNRNYPSTTWETIATNISSIEGSPYPWRVTGPTTTSARIRLVNTANAAQGDTSNANFVISGPTITVTYPANNDSIFVSIPTNITWNSVGVVGVSQIAINRNYPTGTWEVLGTTDDTNHFFPWRPTAPLTNAMRVRVRSLTDTNIVGISAADNRIVTGYIRMVSPVRGDVWGVNTTQVIRWTSNIGGYVRIELNRSYPSNQWEALYPSTQNTGSMDWNVTGVAYRCRFRISYSGVPSIADTTNGDFIITVVSANERYSGIPTEFAIYPAAPNPFNPTTQFQIALPQATNVTVAIYNIMGQHITTLVNETRPAGYQTVRWNATDAEGRIVPSGLYLVRVTTERGWHETQKLMLMK